MAQLLRQFPFTRLQLPPSAPSSLLDRSVIFQMPKLSDEIPVFVEVSTLNHKIIFSCLEGNKIFTFLTLWKKQFQTMLLQTRNNILENRGINEPKKASLAVEITIEALVRILQDSIEEKNDKIILKQ